MRRRKFVQLLGGLAAQSAAMSVIGGKAAIVDAASRRASQNTDANGAAAPATGFGQYTQEYAQFCATPENERVFYALRNGKIVSERLDNSDWKPTDWGEPPELPVPGGSWDGVPLVSPIPNLAGDGPYKPTWESLLQYECPEWYRDAKFGIWNHWSP
ncbi:MAG TPA: alpha-L-fucosidase, partial [Candidatus Acidoferrales bacterium]|nr:alpha-L-fucosidase [Candidatus Acidoferrales bacterium]